ncbi:uncharacterized protein LOC127876631 [Dreissena polymorpha]|uniref:uncharacterized protein LOC127876631 n=1 Tax=Dreissena polymorpha TaxID=45954 RepID=UPI0022643598|nr:uncharacterized protein LOC127876631 [Dreissena polymorpha]
MLWIAIVLKVTVAAAYSVLCPTIEDPCYRYNGPLEIPDMDTRHPSIKIETGAYSQDVYKLRFGLWYISDFPLTSAVVENGNCGTKFPSWINGSTLKLGDGYVNQTACVKDYFDACANTYTVLAKNWGYYYVYCFWALPYADQRFCVDVDLSKVTTTTTTPAATTTTKQTATKVKTAEYYHETSKQSGETLCAEMFLPPSLNRHNSLRMKNGKFPQAFLQSSLKQCEVCKPQTSPNNLQTARTAHQMEQESIIQHSHILFNGMVWIFCLCYDFNSTRNIWTLFGIA